MRIHYNARSLDHPGEQSVAATEVELDLPVQREARERLLYAILRHELDERCRRSVVHMHHARNFARCARISRTRQAGLYRVELHDGSSRDPRVREPVGIRVAAELVATLFPGDAELGRRLRNLRSCITCDGTGTRQTRGGELRSCRECSGRGLVAPVGVQL